MRTKFIVLSATLLCLTSCKEPSTGPFKSLLALERWHREDPLTDFTGTGLVTFHADQRTPRWETLDDNCGAHFGGWADSEFRPPSFGKTELAVGDKTYSFREDGEGAGFDNTEELLWDSGDTLHVTAEGSDEAPGFDVTATVPDLVKLTSHDLNGLQEDELRVARDQPLELTWAPSETDVLVLFLQFAPGNSLEKGVGVWCVYPGDTGGTSVPVAVLERLLPSSPELATNFYVGGVARESLDLEDIDMDVITFKNDAARIQIE